jgi:uncharacterized membrane protein
MSLKRLIRYFLHGCLVTAPLGLTVYIVWMVFGAIDSLLPFKVPGVGFVATIALITLVGVLSSNVVGKSLIDITEGLLQRLPLVKLVYTSIKDLVSAFVGDKKRFDVPVAVTPFPGVDAKVLGFVTREGLARLGLPDHIAVYLPQSYNFAGSLMLFPRDRVDVLDLPASEVMTFIVSGGVSGFGQGESILPPRPVVRA